MLRRSVRRLEGSKKKSLGYSPLPLPALPLWFGQQYIPDTPIKGIFLDSTECSCSKANRSHTWSQSMQKDECMSAQLLSHVQLFSTLWTIAHQAARSMRFSRQEYWSRLPFVPPGHLSNPGIESTSPASPALAARFFTLSHLGSPNS